MHKRIPKKIPFNRETLRRLETGELRQANGAATLNIYDDCCKESLTCGLQCWPGTMLCGI